MSIESDFKDKIESDGFYIKESIVADDKRHLVCANGEKKASFSYCLKAIDDGAVGWYRCFKSGVTHKYSSISRTEYDPEERQRRAQARAKAEAERDAKLSEQRAQVAAECARIWKESRAGEHAYIKRKGVQAIGCRVYKDSLVIPAYKDGKISSLQFIKEDGSKLFKAGGEMRAAYGFVMQKEPLDVIYIAEGWATAASVYMATGCPVVVAFTAGNIKPVYEVMRGKYPNSEIIIAADNDSETDGNPGITAARSTSEHYIAPPICGDWNDYMLAEGIEATKQLLLSKEQPVIRAEAKEVAIAEPEEDWRERLVYDDKGRLAKNNFNNLELYFTHHDSFRERFWYDEFFRRVMVNNNGNVQPLDDEHITALCIACEKAGLNKNFDVVSKIMMLTAKARARNPAKEYFNSLKWDSKPRLDTWLTYYMGAENEPAEYLAFIGKKWLTAAVKRVFEPGCKFDHVLMIEGEQNLGKSTALKTLATFGYEERTYCTDSFNFSHINDKDSITKTNGSIIVEVAEMVGHNKKESEDIKNWITQGVDVARLSYRRNEEYFPRMFVLAGTTNNYQYLRDSTGNRRYWPFECKAIDLEALKKDREQLWAEAVHCYKGGLFIGPTPEESALAVIEQKKRIETDPWEANVEKALILLKHRPFSVNELMDEMGMSMRDKDKRAESRVKNVLVRLGCVHRNLRDGGGKQKWMWVYDGN